MKIPDRQHRAVAISQALEDSPVLARLSGMVRESNERLKAVELLIPAALRSSVKAGPIEEDIWCLLVTSNAAAAKVRQLLPVIQSKLEFTGCKVTSIRLKILKP